MEPYHHQHHPSIVVYDFAEPDITYHASVLTGSAFDGSVPVYAGMKRVNNAVVQDVAVKFAGDKEALTRLRLECHRNDLLAAEHPNVVGVTKHFTYDGFFCVVLPRFDSSLRSASRRICHSQSDVVLALKHVLRGLSCIHDKGHIHGQVDADHVYVNFHNDDSRKLKEIKLGYAASIYDLAITERGGGSSIYLPDNERLTRKSDMWSVGIMALELVYGVDLRSFKEARAVLDALFKGINKSERLPSKERMMNCMKSSSSSRGGGLLSCIGRRSLRNDDEISDFWKPFSGMIADCLDSDPLKRPSADELLDADLFKQHDESRLFRSMN